MNRAWILGVACAAALGGNAWSKNLLDVYERALVADPLMQQATAVHMAALETKTQALENLLPVSASLNKDWQGIGSTRVNSAATASLGITVNLFSWDNWVALKSANASVAQAEANYDSARQNLVQRVATQYFAVLAAQDTLTAEESSLASSQKQLDQAERRFQVGLIAITDVQIARAARDSDAAAVIAGKRSLQSAQDQLRTITGETYDTLAAPGDNMPLLTPDPASEDAWVSAAMSQNASLVASRMSAEIARDNVLSAYGGYAPSITASVSRAWAIEHGNFNNSSTAAQVIGANSGLSTTTNTSDIIWQLGISVPIFTSGVHSQVRQAHYSWEAARSGLDYTTRTTEQQARDAYQGVISQIAQVQALKQAVQSNQVSLQATQAGYDVGTKTAVDVLTSRQALVQAETNYAQAKYSYLNDIVALRLAAGELDRTTIQTINGWLAEPRPAVPGVPAPPGSGGTATAPGATVPVAPLNDAANPTPTTPPGGPAVPPVQPSAPLTGAPAAPSPGAP